MLRRWQGWIAAIVVTAGTMGLVVLDLGDAGFRRWWDIHALTTDVVAGLLGLLITVLVIDQVVGHRQVRDRSRATAAQAAILLSQATRSCQAVSAALGAQGDRDAASDEVRTYMSMLLIAAPILIETPVPRHFLEEAQYLGGVMARTLVRATTSEAMAAASVRLDDAITKVRQASTPLLDVLNLQERAAAGGADPTPTPGGSA